MCCPAPLHDNLRQQLQDLADQIAAHLCPRTRAYHELWLKDLETGEETLAGGGSDGHEVEPIYGPTYLPRKFKTAIGLASDNCIDLYANDLGLMAVVEGGRIIGYNVLVGGGMGVTPSAAKTFPAVAKRMAFIRPEQVIDVATAIVKVQRDFGNRSDRKVARLKYLIHNWGLDAFKAKVEEYYGQPLDEPHSDDVHGFDDHIGWHEQGDGNWFYGLNVENGRIKDEGDFRLKSALRKICSTLRPGIRLTAHQSILFTDIKPEDRDTLVQILREHGIKLHDEISNVRALFDGLRGLAHLRARDHRKRARVARPDRSTGSRASEAGPFERNVYAPHDRLPERLRPALQLRHRPGGQSGRPVHGLRRRTPAGRPAQLQLQGHGPGRGSHPDDRARAGLLQARAQRR